MLLKTLNYFSQPYLSLVSSFWPLIISIALLPLPLIFVMWARGSFSSFYLLLSVTLVALVAFLWWRDVVRESLVGFHTFKLEHSFRLGVVFFIASEVLFFFSFFWAFYDRRVSPRVELGLSWPPKGILPLGVYSVPLLNTVILLSSGVSVTWAHHSILMSDYASACISLLMTVLLGAYFIYIQYEEYSEAAFSISDGVYGSTFFIRTGFHGIHVVVGTLILMYSFIHMFSGKFTSSHHFIFEASAWYWHFVDVVWLFLYVSVYWWGRI